MAKLTMEEYGKITAAVLSLPRKNRDMLLRALEEKRMAEDVKSSQGVLPHYPPPNVASSAPEAT